MLVIIILLTISVILYNKNCYEGVNTSLRLLFGNTRTKTNVIIFYSPSACRETLYTILYCDFSFLFLFFYEHNFLSGDQSQLRSLTRIITQQCAARDERIEET
jgi:hypothetical protein